MDLAENAMKGDAEKFLDAGMNYYIAKPISTKKIKDVFNTFVTKI